MNNPAEEYNRLHDHCQALARERDAAVRKIDELIKQKVIYSVFIMKVYSTSVNFAVFDSCR